MEGPLEKFSQSQLKEMSEQQVFERMAYLQEIQQDIFIEIDACKERLGILNEKCEGILKDGTRCNSTNLLRRKSGGYFCRKCGFVKEGPRRSIIDANAEQKGGTHQCRP